MLLETWPREWEGLKQEWQGRGERTGGLGCYGERQDHDGNVNRGRLWLSRGFLGIIGEGEEIGMGTGARLYCAKLGVRGK